jgi:hypothetical protein
MYLRWEKIALVLGLLTTRQDFKFDVQSPDDVITLEYRKPMILSCRGLLLIPSPVVVARDIVI